jgi:hypothetical protein
VHPQRHELLVLYFPPVRYQCHVHTDIKSLKDGKLVVEDFFAINHNLITLAKVNQIHQHRRVHFVVFGTHENRCHKIYQQLLLVRVNVAFGVSLFQCALSVVNVQQLDCVLECSRYQIKGWADFEKQKFKELVAFESVFSFKLFLRGDLVLEPDLFLGHDWS